jgi:hypothetical protein
VLEDTHPSVRPISDLLGALVTLAGAKHTTLEFEWQPLLEETRKAVTELVMRPSRPSTPRSPAQLDGKAR